MAEQLASIGQSIQVAISNLSSEVALGHIISSIPMWDGNSAGCDQFIKAVEDSIRYSADSVTDRNKTRLVKIAHLRTTSLAKKCLSNYISSTQEAQITWAAAKKKLLETFSPPTDPRIELEKMRSMKQKPDMSLSVYAQLLETQVPKAFPTHDLNDALLQQELCNIFIKGIINQRVRNKLIIADPSTLVEALNKAVSESKVQARIEAFNSDKIPSTATGFSTPRVEEPMDCNELEGRYIPADAPQIDTIPSFQYVPFESMPIPEENGYEYVPFDSMPIPEENGYDQSPDSMPIPEENGYDYDFDYNQSNLNALSSMQPARTCHICQSPYHLMRQCPRKPIFQPRPYHQAQYVRFRPRNSNPQQRMPNFAQSISYRAPPVRFNYQQQAIPVARPRYAPRVYKQHQHPAPPGGKLVTPQQHGFPRSHFL